MEWCGMVGSSKGKDNSKQEQAREKHRRQILQKESKERTGGVTFADATNKPPITIAVAITQNTLVSAIALKMESNEKTRFIIMIIVITLLTEAFPWCSISVSTS